LVAGGFLWLMWFHEPYSARVSPGDLLQRRLVIVGLAAVLITLILILDTEWLVFFFHLSVASGLMLPRREAYAAVAGLAITASALGIPSDLGFFVLPTAAIGLWAIAFAGQVAAVEELQAAREELAKRAVAEERLRFARDLHDLLGHSLSLIALKSELAGRLLPGAPGRAAKEIREAEEVARRALREVREAVAGYRQPSLIEELHGAVEMLEAAGIACRIEDRVGLLPKSVESMLAWAVREGVTNVIRHSRAHQCDIRLVREDGVAVAEVSDDGRGQSRAGDGAGGSGLSGLAERVAGVEGALFEVGPLLDGGFRLRVSIPVEDGGSGEEGQV
jgi:two-component system sensor histidine kinase DesK